jgi:hypothetical protein
MREVIVAVAIAAALGIAGGPATAVADNLTTEEVVQIDQLLEDMQCEVDVEDIEKKDDGYELDDVFCADGQYDIELNTNLQVVEKKAE